MVEKGAAQVREEVGEAAAQLFRSVTPTRVALPAMAALVVQAAMAALAVTAVRAESAGPAGPAGLAVEAAFISRAEI